MATPTPRFYRQQIRRLADRIIVDTSRLARADARGLHLYAACVRDNITAAAALAHRLAPHAVQLTAVKRAAGVAA